MDRFLAMNSQVKPTEAYDELFGRKNYEGVAIHTARLAERVRNVAREVYDDFYDSRSRRDCMRIFHAVHHRLLNDTKLTKCFSKGMLKVLAEGVMMQIFLTFKW